MPYPIRNPWDRLPPAGLQGVFRRWTNLAVDFTRQATPTASIVTTNRSVILRYEVMMFVATGYAGGSSLTVPATDGLTVLGRFRNIGGAGAFLLPSGGSPTGGEELMTQTWLARPTGAFPAYAQTLPNRSATGPFKITGQTSGATASVDFTGLSAQPYLHNAGAYFRMFEQFTGATSPQLSGYMDEFGSPPGYAGFYRLTWQAGPSRYPVAVGADLSPTQLRFPSGFIDGEAVLMT